jgi:hypothetical protein
MASRLNCECERPRPIAERAAPLHAVSETAQQRDGSGDARSIAELRVGHPFLALTCRCCEEFRSFYHAPLFQGLISRGSLVRMSAEGDYETDRFDSGRLEADVLRRPA